MNEISVSKHSFTSKGRDGIEIDGVNEVISFDESGVVMETLCGSLAVEGDDLHITVLDITDGRVEIEGKVNSVYYFDNTPRQKRGLFGRKND